MTDTKPTTKCAECQFESDTGHSQACSQYKKPVFTDKVIRVCRECGKTHEEHEPTGIIGSLTVNKYVECWGLKSRFRLFTPVDKGGEKLIITNPNGANQYDLDPRQRICWKAYITPSSKTFANAYQSAILAGYTEGTATTITTRQWFIDKLRRLNLLNKAEKVLEEMLDMPVEIVSIPRTRPKHWDEDGDEDLEAQTDEDMLAHDALEDEKAIAYMKTDPALVKIKQDTAKFVAERQGKDEGWNSRNEITGAGGKDLIPVDPKAKEQANKAIDDFLNGGAQPEAGASVTMTNENVPVFIKRSVEASKKLDEKAQ